MGCFIFRHCDQARLIPLEALSSKKEKAVFPKPSSVDLNEKQLITIIVINGKININIFFFIVTI